MQTIDQLVTVKNIHQLECGHQILAQLSQDKSAEHILESTKVNSYNIVSKSENMYGLLSYFHSEKSIMTKVDS